VSNISAISDAIAGMANDYPHLSELAITRICRKAWPSLARFEVVDHLARRSIDRPATNAGDEYTLANIQADAAEGMSHDMIAAKYGKTVGDVRYDGGLPSTTPAPEEGEDMESAIGEIPKTMRKDNVANRISAKEIAELRAQGKGWKEIAAAIGVAHSTIYKLINSYNLPREPEECRAWLDGKPKSAAANTTPIAAAEPEPATEGQPPPPPRNVRPQPIVITVKSDPIEGPKSCAPPLLTIKRAGIDAEEAKRRYLPLIHAALFDGGRVDIDICIREVQA